MRTQTRFDTCWRYARQSCSWQDSQRKKHRSDTWPDCTLYNQTLGSLPGRIRVGRDALLLRNW